MHRLSIVLFLFLTINSQIKSQILPREGNILNYRRIGFAFPQMQKATGYQIEIAAGNYYREDSFKRNLIKTIDTKTTKIIGEVPSFGKQYTWRVIYITGLSKYKKGTFYHFSTGIIPGVDSTVTRFRILKHAEEYKDSYVFLDANKALFDMSGRPVWYLPNPETIDKFVRDLKITRQGTITYVIDDQGAYEINYNGDILWKGPDNGIVNGAASEHYHHEFTKLKNGHYMVLGTEFVLFKVPTLQDTSIVVISQSELPPGIVNANYRKAPMGTIIEYDRDGHVAWSWKSSKYFNGSDLFYRRGPDGGILIHTHENGFYFNEQDSVIFICFRDINRIIKIKYPEGYVMNTFGNIYRQGVMEGHNSMFCSQHSFKNSSKGYDYVYNNNICNYPALPQVIKLQEPISGKDSLKKIWEYNCTIEGMLETKQDPSKFTSGGNVIELPDGSIFVSMSTPYSKVFIVSEEKEILWSGLPEKWNQPENRWEPFPQYKASIITNKEDLEYLIWNSEKK